MSEWRGKNPHQVLSLRDPTLTDAQFDTILRACFMHRFGLSWRLPDLPAKWRERLKAHLKSYSDDVVPFVRSGDLYRLTLAPSRSGGGEQHPAFQLVLGNRHLLLGFALDPEKPLGIAQSGAFKVVPRGLDPTRRYELRELARTQPATTRTASGAEWMASGVPVSEGSSFAGILEPR